MRVVGFDLLDSAAYIREHGGVPLEPYEIVDRMLDGVIARLDERVPWRPRCPPAAAPSSTPPACRARW